MSATPLHPDGSADEHDPDVAALAGAYRVVADAFVYPEEIDRDTYLERARDEVLPAVEAYLDPEAADLLSSFLDAYEGVGVDEFVETLELEPACPPYLGHHEFAEPETCRDIADADRNQYMVELNAIYEHFGFEIGDELPDYLPAMVEFCWLTLPDRGDEVRAEFVGGMLSLLPGMRDAYEAADTPYYELLAALERLLEYDLALSTNRDGTEWDESDDTEMHETIDVAETPDCSEAMMLDESPDVPDGRRRVDSQGGDL